MTTPEISDLQQDAQFQLLAELGHDNIMPFVSEHYWQKKTWVTWLHYLFSLAILAVWVIIGLQDKLSFDAWFTQFGYAVLAFVVLLPVHELIHGVVYQAFGARDVRYGMSLRNFYAYAIAHRFVANQRIFSWVALAPFMVINGLLILAILFFPTISFFLLGVLLLHTAGTSGDWALINFLWLNRQRQVYTFDDAHEKKSYFYANSL